jgi:hypothetical protein
VTRCAATSTWWLAEALDRISRDQEYVAGVFKRMAFADVKIITLSEGEITRGNPTREFPEIDGGQLLILLVRAGRSELYSPQ